jgi:hypothetical protein
VLTGLFGRDDEERERERERKMYNMQRVHDNNSYPTVLITHPWWETYFTCPP